MATKESLERGAPSFYESPITPVMYPKTIECIRTVSSGDDRLAALLVASFEHGGWLANHVRDDQAIRRGLRPESIRDRFRSTEAHLILAQSDRTLTLQTIRRVIDAGDYRVGYERYVASRWGMPFPAFLHRLLAHYTIDPEVRDLMQTTLDRIHCRFGETDDKDRLRRNILIGIRQERR